MVPRQRDGRQHHPPAGDIRAGGTVAGAYLKATDLPPARNWSEFGHSCQTVFMTAHLDHALACPARMRRQLDGQTVASSHAMSFPPRPRQSTAVSSRSSGRPVGEATVNGDPNRDSTGPRKSAALWVMG
jgi:hypothetical protein